MQPRRFEPPSHAEYFFPSRDFAFSPLSPFLIVSMYPSFAGRNWTLVRNYLSLYLVMTGRCHARSRISLFHPRKRCSSTIFPLIGSYVTNFRRLIHRQVETASFPARLSGPVFSLCVNDFLYPL